MNIFNPKSIGGYNLDFADAVSGDLSQNYVPCAVTSNIQTAQASPFDDTKCRVVEIPVSSDMFLFHNNKKRGIHDFKQLLSHMMAFNPSFVVELVVYVSAWMAIVLVVRVTDSAVPASTSRTRQTLYGRSVVEPRPSMLL